MVPGSIPGVPTKYMTHYCYIIESAKGKKYVGTTTDVERRLQEHNSQHGNSKRFTKKSSEWKLIHLEVFEDAKEAHTREKQIKSWKGGNALKNLLELRGPNQDDECSH